MADLSKLVTEAVAIVRQATLSLQATVLHSAWLGTYTDSGEPVLATAVPRKAVLEAKQDLVVATDGTQSASRWKLTLVEPLMVTVLDRFQLPDGTSPRILSTASPIDANGLPFITEVWTQ